MGALYWNFEYNPEKIKAAKNAALNHSPTGRRQVRKSYEEFLKKGFQILADAIFTAFYNSHIDSTEICFSIGEAIHRQFQP